MQFQVVPIAGERKAADLVLLPFWKEEKKSVAAFSRKEIGEGFLSLLEADFQGKIGELLFSYYPDGLEKRVLLVGLGSKKECNASELRKAFSAALSFARKKKLENLNFFLPKDLGDETSLEAMIDALWMANYSYDVFKKESLKKENPFPLIKKVTLVGRKKEELTPLLQKRKHLMEGVNLARDLVNGNADDVQAAYLSQIAHEIAQGDPERFQVKVLGKKELEKEEMGLMLAVGRGALPDPALILLQYQGDPKSKDLTAVVGKGITFDTGGLNLKPTGSIETMKCDMAGAAAVLGILKVCQALKLKKNVLGVIAAAENAISAEAYKPGDVYISHSGKSVEITNTDAEGRLVLADALSYIQTHYDLSRVVDLATLTGGVIVALGEEATGLFSNDDALTKQLKEASTRTGERVWELPLYPEYLDALKSSIADLKNARSGRKASSGSGAMFLKQFIEKDLPWAHLDIAGTAYVSETSPYFPSYATGVGVKLLIELLENLP